jgi:hypothetical protein
MSVKSCLAPSEKERCDVKNTGFEKMRPGIPLALVIAAQIIVAAQAIPAADPAADRGTPHPSPLRFIDTSIENASPAWWEVADDGTVRVHLTYDHERSSPNRANGHWLFRIEAEPGADLVLSLGPFGNIWNGKPAGPVPEATISFVSDDGETWRVIKAEPDEPYRLKLRVHMNGPSLHVARLEPYTVSRLEQFMSHIVFSSTAAITSIGKTVDGRNLDLIVIGNVDAPHRVFIRARAHAWEPGGNWAVEGLVRRLLRDDEQARKCLACYCLFIVPMANKDGVARGRTRFNAKGKDLNRNWDQPADPAEAPENAAIEAWLDSLRKAKRLPELAIDFHNDADGKLHVGVPEIDNGTKAAYLRNMNRLETLLREKTWFTEGSTSSSFRNPGTIGEGLLARYGIHACIHELNANWIRGLNDYPSSKHWQTYGEHLADVLLAYFEGQKPVVGSQ